jgi:hypothetical protein
MNKLRPWKTTALIGLAYIVVVVLMTWPAIRYLSQQLVGNNEDTWIFFWNNWWLREALTSGQSPFQTPYLFYPAGTSLIAHSNSFLNSFLAFLLEPLIVGPVAAYNLVLLSGLWLGALGMYLLVKEITSHVLASFLAGFVFAFAPYHLSQIMAHAHLGSVHWWPFYALFLGRTLRDGRWRDAVAAGIFGALTIWSGLQLGLFLAIWTIVYLLWFLGHRWADAVGDKQFMIHTIGRIGLIGLVALVVSAPILRGVIGNWSILADNSGVFDESLQKQTDLLAYLVPPIYNPLWGDQFPDLFERFGFNGTFRPYLGFAVLALALAAVWQWRKEARFWLISACLWLLLAAGPALRLNGIVYEQLLLPYRWIATTFPISAIRAPDRFNLLLVFSVAVLAGTGAAYLARHHLWRWAIVPLGLLVVIEYLPIPIPRMELPAASAFLEEMAADEAAYAVLDYPMGYTDSKNWLYYQTLHGKPMVEGHISRYSGDTYAFIANHLLLSTLYEGADQPKYLPDDFFQGKDSPLTILGPAMRDLQAAGVRYILLHRQSASEEELAVFEDVFMPLFPVYEDDSLSVYDLSRPRPIHFGRPPAAIGPDAQLVQSIARFNPEKTELEIDLLTQKTNQGGGEYDCRLILSGSPMSIPFNPFPGEADWQPGDLSFQTFRLSVPSDLSPGRYDWQISCPGSAAFTGPDSLYTGDDETVLLSQEINLQYNDGINLNGYRWWIDKSDLHIVLHWFARNRVNRDYKFFIHLINDAGAIVRQYDAVHCNWDCPSSRWAVGQSIVDDTVMPLQDLPAGEYRLAIGLYNGETSDRLPVRDDSGRIVPDSYYILSDMFFITSEP